jgi:hypothetical protein
LGSLVFGQGLPLALGVRGWFCFGFGRGFGLGRGFGFRSREFDVGFSCLISLAPVRSGKVYRWRLGLEGGFASACVGVVLEFLAIGVPLALGAGGGSSRAHASFMSDFLA